LNPAAVLIPLCVVAVAFDIFCLADVARAEQVRHLPRWAWALLCLSAVGGVIYVLVGRVPAAREYQRGYGAAISTLNAADDVVGSAVPVSAEFDLRQWAAERKSALRAAAAGSGYFQLPAWFAPLADDLGSLLDPVGFDRWSFTPTDPFLRGYQAALRDTGGTQPRRPPLAEERPPAPESAADNLQH
jgi:hypothetical protein